MAISAIALRQRTGDAVTSDLNELCFGALLQGDECVYGSQRAAIAYGSNLINTYHDSELEEVSCAHELMCIATAVTHDVAIAAHVFEMQTRDATSANDADYHRTARLLRDLSSGVARLVSRSLEVHARDTGYEVAIWQLLALESLQGLVKGEHDFDESRETLHPTQLSRQMSRTLVAALTATKSDRMAIPGCLAESLGASVALFMISRAVVCAEDARYQH